MALMSFTDIKPKPISNAHLSTRRMEHSCPGRYSMQQFIVRWNIIKRHLKRNYSKQTSRPRRHHTSIELSRLHAWHKYGYQNTVYGNIIMGPFSLTSHENTFPINTKNINVHHSSLHNKIRTYMTQLPQSDLWNTYNRNILGQENINEYNYQSST